MNEPMKSYLAPLGHPDYLSLQFLLFFSAQLLLDHSQSKQANEAYLVHSVTQPQPQHVMLPVELCHSLQAVSAQL